MARHLGRARGCGGTALADGQSGPGIGGMFAAETRKSASNARHLIAAFDDVCARQVAMRRGTMYEHLLEHCTPNVTVVDEKHLRKPHSGVELCKHLARHGVEVTFDKTPAEGRTIGEVLEGMQSSATSTCW